MDVVPAGIWAMWILNFGMAIFATVVAFVLNKREDKKNSSNS